MVNSLEWISSNPEFTASIIAVFGFIVREFFPQSKILFGPARKIVKELIDLHLENDLDNKKILEAAINSGKNEAAKLLIKHLT